MVRVSWHEYSGYIKKPKKIYKWEKNVNKSGSGDKKKLYVGRKNMVRVSWPGHSGYKRKPEKNVLVEKNVKK